jgi:hypothetical protein
MGVDLGEIFMLSRTLSPEQKVNLYWILCTLEEYGLASVLSIFPESVTSEEKKALTVVSLKQASHKI